MGELLERIDNPDDLRGLDLEELPQVVEELRDFIIQVTSQTGGHLGASLGAADLIVALHYVYDTPRDKIVWDVGHQTYAHKILTGRRDRFSTLRQGGGLAGFPDRNESEYDHMNTGHGGTSISAALGMATARDLRGEDFRVLAVIGDGSLTAGMAFEALNNAGDVKRDLTVILNDNKMGISPNVGAMCSYLTRIMTGEWANRARRVRNELQKIVAQVPLVGEAAVTLMDRTEEALKSFLVPGILFEELGFRYIGPVDGHRLDHLVPTLRNVRNLRGPNLVHVVTEKGFGYPYSVAEPTTYHGVTKFDPETGNFLKKAGPPSYSKIFADTLIELSRRDEKIVAVSAAMLEGTGLVGYQKVFPDRCFDVGMCEQHAVTFAAGLALQGMKPVASIYSTFLQRAYDQIIHDVCLTAVPVTFTLDRAGLVGDDGPTHQGAFDITYLRCLPHMVIMAPKDGGELRRMLSTAIEHSGPAAIRFPRGPVPDNGLGEEEVRPIPIGEAEILREGEDVAVLALGPMVGLAMDSAEQLAELRVEAAVVNLRFVKPLDEEKILGLARRCRHIVTVEEGVRIGGVGSGVLELLADHGLDEVRVSRLGIPDCFVEHDAPPIQREHCGLTPGDITQAVRDLLEGGGEGISSHPRHEKRPAAR